MNRRELLELVTVAGFAGTTAVRAAESPMPSADHHDHAAMSKYGDLIVGTTHCVNAGEACIAQCLVLLGQGDKDLAACAKTVQDTVASCTALRQLAAANSPHVGELASVVDDICKEQSAASTRRSIASVTNVPRRVLSVRRNVRRRRLEAKLTTLAPHFL